MEFSEVLNYCLYIVLTVLLPVITKYAVNLIQTKIKESNVIAAATKNRELTDIIESALSDVMDSVLYINQIYVDSLKANGRFDETAQKEAFHRAYTEAANMISNETKTMIAQAYGSFDKWLKLKIESSVNVVKK